MSFWAGGVGPSWVKMLLSCASTLAARPSVRKTFEVRILMMEAELRDSEVKVCVQYADVGSKGYEVQEEVCKFAD